MHVLVTALEFQKTSSIVLLLQRIDAHSNLCRLHGLALLVENHGKFLNRCLTTCTSVRGAVCASTAITRKATSINLRVIVAWILG